MSLGIWQIVLILLIVLILFGAGKLPKVMGDVAKGVRNFKSGLKDDTQDEQAEQPKVIQAEPVAAREQTVANEPAPVKKDEAVKG